MDIISRYFIWVNNSFDSILKLEPKDVRGYGITNQEAINDLINKLKKIDPNYNLRLNEHQKYIVYLDWRAVYKVVRVRIPYYVCSLKLLESD